MKRGRQVVHGEKELQEEIDRLKNQILDGLRVMLQQPGTLARYVTDRVVYGSGEYGHAAGGTVGR